MNRKKKFSQNWKKSNVKITKLHPKISMVRSDFIHKVTSTISKNHAIVCIEDLQVKNMSASARVEQPFDFAEMLFCLFRK